MEVYYPKESFLSYRYSKVRRQTAIIAYVLLCFRGCLGWLGIDTIFFTILLNLLIVLSIDFNKIERIFLLIPFLCLLIFINKQILGTIDIIVMCLILKDRSITKLSRSYIYILFIFIPVWLFLLSNGFIVSDRWFDPNKGGEFYDYGFASPNGLGIFGFNIVATLFLSSKRKYSLTLIFILLIINQIFYVLSNCRTAWIGGIVLIFCTIINRFYGFNKLTKYPLAILPIIISVILIYLAKHLYQYQLIDILLSGRLSIYNSILSQMTLKNWIFGITLPSGPMDGSYMMLLFTGGIITLLFYFYLNYRMMIKRFSLIKYYLPFILAIMACGVEETTFSCSGLSLLYWMLLINSSK